MRVAIIGSGVSGLVAGWRLHRRHEVTLLEADDRIGGHVNTVHVAEHAGRLTQVPRGAAGALPVDTGFIVHNPVNYPILCRIFSELQVPVRDTVMSFSVDCQRTGVTWAGRDLGTVFAQRSNLFSIPFLRMLAGILRFNRAARDDLLGDGPTITLGDWLRRHGLSGRVIDHYVVPIGAAIWSAPPSALLDFPARGFAQFLHNHGMLQAGDDRPVWRTVVGGSQVYVDRITDGWQNRIRTASPVARVRRRPDGVLVQVVGAADLVVDRVIFACHSDQALRLIDAPTADEQAVLGALPYQENPATLHTDTRWLPPVRRAWSAWNFRTGLGDAALVTYWMDELQGLHAPSPLLVTLNHAIDPAHTLYRTTYHHPRFHAGTPAAQARRAAISGADRLHFCGAYWGHGFHEDGAASGLAVARELGDCW
jgi:uncharacterized protein